MHPLGGVTPVTFMPMAFNLNNPGNAQTVIEFLAHDVVVQAAIINPMSTLYVQAPPSSNMLRWRQIDMMNAHIQQAVREIMAMGA